MTEKELVAKIKELRQIKPSQDWVVLTKGRILEKEPVDIRGRASDSFVSVISVIIDGIKRETSFVFRHKPAFAILTVLFVLVGVFGFAQKSVPGDTLFAIKKITERSQAVFISEKEEPKHNLELVNKRLEDLVKIAESNQTEKLAPAINEVKASVSEATKSLAKEAAKSLTREEPDKIKEIAKQVKEIEEKKQVLGDYGVAGLKEQEEIVKITAELLIEDYEGTVLSEQEQEVLTEAKEDCEKGDYSQALEKLLLLR